MHAYRKFVEDEMDRRGWKPVDLSKASGVSKQVLSNLLKDDRDRLRMLPGQDTVAGLARAFSVPESVILHRIGLAMGLPVVEPVQVPDASRVPNDELIRELARRLGEAGGEHDQRSAPRYAAGQWPADRDESHPDDRVAADLQRELEEHPLPGPTSLLDEASEASMRIARTKRDASRTTKESTR